MGTIVAIGGGMEIQDGFIISIHNYCDAWCEQCPFTSWCRVFAARAEMEAGLDPYLRPIVEAPPLRHELPPEPPAWVAEFLSEADEDARAASLEGGKPSGSLDQLMRPRVAAAHQLLADFAMGYMLRLHDWMKAGSANNSDDPLDPRCIIGWYGTLFPAKVHRAVRGLTDALLEGPDDGPVDYDGSAKVALIAVDRSRAAWIDAVERNLVPVRIAEPFITDLTWLHDELEKTFPNARAFVRPAFDEPDDVERLLRQP